MLGLPTPLAVVAHDAGAANIILTWLRAESQPLVGVLPVMKGPAARLWTESFPDAPPPLSLDEALYFARAVLSGTGWASDLEHRSRVEARRRHLRSVAVIDHWVNYRARFERDGELVLPERVWVTDAYALAEAQRTIPEVYTELKHNSYLQEQAAAAGSPPINGDVLLVLEPARSTWGRAVQGELQALDWYWRCREAVASRNTPIRLRPHPSDPEGKYDRWMNTHPGVVLDTSGDIAGALRRATVVVGLQSAAMIVALAAARTVFSTLPPWAPPCPLPHEGIIHLRLMGGDNLRGPSSLPY